MRANEKECNWLWQVKENVNVVYKSGLIFSTYLTLDVFSHAVARAYPPNYGSSSTELWQQHAFTFVSIPWLAFGAKATYCNPTPFPHVSQICKEELLEVCSPPNLKMNEEI